MRSEGVDADAAFAAEAVDVLSVDHLEAETELSLASPAATSGRGSEE